MGICLRNRHIPGIQEYGWNIYIYVWDTGICLGYRNILRIQEFVKDTGICQGYENMYGIH